MSKRLIVLVSMVLLIAACGGAPAEVIIRECEWPDKATVGGPISRSMASAREVHGQFGARMFSYTASKGSVWYTVAVPADGFYYWSILYSKNSDARASVSLFIDGRPRGRFLPQPTGDWNSFQWSEKVRLGFLRKGTHTLRLFTRGQEKGVADLDVFVLGSAAEVEKGREWKNIDVNELRRLAGEALVRELKESESSK